MKVNEVHESDDLCKIHSMLFGENIVLNVLWKKTQCSTVPILPDIEPEQKGSVSILSWFPINNTARNICIQQSWTEQSLSRPSLESLTKLKDYWLSYSLQRMERDLKIH